MERFAQWLTRFVTGERGQDMVEYAMIIVTISIPVVLAGIVLSPAFTTWANGVADTVSTASPW